MDSKDPRLSWLFLLCRSRYLALIYDEDGNPTYAPHYHNHSYYGLLQALASNTIFTHYDITLEAYQAIVQTESSQRLALENHLLTHGFFGDYPHLFPSKNVAESTHLLPLFSIKIPMTIAALFPMDGAQVLAVVAMDPFLSRFLAADNSCTVLADDRGAIFGYSALFSRPLKLPFKDALLGKQLDEVVRIEKDAFEEREESPSWRTLFKEEGERLQPSLLFSHHQGLVQFDPVSNALLIHNTSAEMLYISLPDKVAVDSMDLRLHITFSAPGKKIPNGILRGTPLEKDHSPDWTSYAFTNTASEQTLRFRKGARDVQIYEQPQALPSSHRTLLIEKRNRRFSFTLDGTCVGNWTDSMPFSHQDESLFYLFVRPGETLHLHALHIESAPSTNASSFPLIRASYHELRHSPTYLARIEQDVHRGHNYTIYRLEDISPLTQSIQRLEREKARLQELLVETPEFVGKSEPIRKIREELPLIAGSDLTILIEGPTGTGKEVLAKAIHEQSGRKGKWVKVDCAALPISLMESELFGHCKGAFTGATSDRMGKFEQAHQGTLFLDEISNLSMDIQAKLLNVLQDKQITRLGSTEGRRIDFRVIGATNTPIESLVARGLFRSDLYYRLLQLRFLLPPLSSRLEDLPLLCTHFIDIANKRYHKKIEGLSLSALSKLFAHPWSGNVRELQNVIFRAHIFATGHLLEATDISFENENIFSVREQRPPGRKVHKRGTITATKLFEAMKRAQGNVSVVARELGYTRASIHAALKRHHFAADDFRME